MVVIHTRSVIGWSIFIGGDSITLKIRAYSDDEYYTTKENAEKFFEKVVVPSGILKHKTLLMPFSNAECPLSIVAKKYHDNIVTYEGNQNLWKNTEEYDDVVVVDNPPFSMSALIEKKYTEEGTPFVLFRSAVSYPKFIFKKPKAGVVYENSAKGVKFYWGIGKHIQGDEYIKTHYPNLVDNLRTMGALDKAIPIGFSFFDTDYYFKVKSVTFSEIVYPNRKDKHVYVNQGVYDENTKIYEDEDDGRIHLISK